jgi:hypothetical protein
MGSVKSTFQGKKLTSSDIESIGKQTQEVYIENCWSSDWPHIVQALSRLKNLRNLSIIRSVMPLQTLQWIC